MKPAEFNQVKTILQRKGVSGAYGLFGWLLVG
jgi:hypothetical protein